MSLFQLPQAPTHEPLQLTWLSVIQLRLKLQKPFITSFGRQDERDTLLVMLRTQDGLVGIGETPSMAAPMYDENYLWADLDVLQRFLIPTVSEQLKGVICCFDDLESIFKPVKGHRFSKCGLEAAYWHLVAQQKNVALASLWGGRAESVQAGFSIGAKTLDDVLERAERAIQAGFKRLKVKIWPGFDRIVLEAIRNQYPNIMLQADANTAYDPFSSEHIAALKTLDELDLLLIEQPFAENRLLDHARFQAEHNLKTPICLDESIRDLNDVRQAIDLWRLFEVSERLVINVKPPRVGGYWESVRIATYCQAHQVPCWVGGMLETGLGKWMNISLAAHSAFNLPGDHLQPQPYYQQDIINPLPTLRTDGTVIVPSGEIGEIDWETLERLQVARFDFQVN
ncbi:MAG: o-succinylbenzoate synthase [Phototrophicales bacterium]|nr:MAG: o-succinylbenzoate synthase [Phototrophicales bacterium]